MIKILCDTLIELANSPTVHSLTIAVIMWVTIAIVKK